MNKKGRHISIGHLIFLIFLFLCAIINLVSGQIGAAICSLGAGIFYLALSLAAYEEIKKGEGSNDAVSNIG